MIVLEKVFKVLVKILKRMLKHFLKVNGDWVDWRLLQLAVVTQLGTAAITLDQKYKVLTLDEWKQIIRSDTLNITKKWKKDVFDCDNFAITFNAHCAEYYEVNTAGIAIGTIKHAGTLKNLGKHAYNILAVKENNELVLYLYEPQTDGLVKAGKQVRLGNWIYETEIVIFG